jgi:hypothetical protein
MKQSSWPEIQMINQKNYYTSVPSTPLIVWNALAQSALLSALR